MKKFVFLSMIIIIFISCNDDNDSSLIKFEGYTMTDNVGSYFGTIDSSDWTSDPVWNDAEKKLFSDFSKYMDAYQFNSGEKVYPAYPNPITNSNFTGIVFDKLASTEIKLRVVDYRWKTQIAIDSTFLPEIAMDLSEAPCNKDSLIRIYYMLVRNDSCFLKGHGDVSLKRSL